MDELSVATGAQKVLEQVRRVVVGKDRVLMWVFAAILAKGSMMRRATILGVISPTTRMITVITIVTMEEATSPVIAMVAARLTASTVATEVAAMFTRLLPTRTVDNAKS